MDAPDDVKFTLLENGLDYIASALENLGGVPTKRPLKYGLLHLTAGIELVLKERLRREDWTMVFEKPEAARKEMYDTGNFRSVGLEACLERLAEHCGVDLPDEAAAAWRTLRNRRNPMEHYDFSSTTDAIKAVTSKALGCLIDFMGAELGLDQFGETEHELLEVVRKRLCDFDTFVDDRTEAIAPELTKLEDGGRRVLTCPSCLQHALVLDAESCSPSCLFCRYQREGSGRRTTTWRRFSASITLPRSRTAELNGRSGHALSADSMRSSTADWKAQKWPISGSSASRARTRGQAES